MDDQVRLLKLAFAGLVLLAGCSGPVQAAGVRGSSRVVSAPLVKLEARPREVKLDGKAPCQLLRADQLPGLRIDRPGRPGRAPAFKAEECAWTVTGASSRLVLVTSEGIEVWTGGDRVGRPGKAAPIGGFSAITVTVNLPSQRDRCDVMVDTAAGQYLLATFDVSPSFRARFPGPCDGARQLAEAAMENVVR